MAKTAKHSAAPGKHLALGIDLGGTSTGFGIVDHTGKIIEQGDMPTTGHPKVEDFIADLKKRVMPMLEKAGLEHIAGGGVGAPNGNFYTGEVAYAPNLPWEGVIPFAKLLSDALGIKVTLTNDAKAAAIGEMIYGAAKDMKDFILITLGTGVGSGFVANGHLIYGHDGFAGELGHVTAIRGGRKCGCGRLGCLEAYASATGITRSAEEWLITRKDHTTLRAHAGRLSARLIDEAAKHGDAMALELFEYTGNILGRTLADAVAITSPQAIIFFGGLAKAGEMLISHVRTSMEENLLRVFKGKVQIMFSALPDADAAILGASALVW